MKKICLLLFFVLAFTGSALAQGNQCRTSPVGASTPNCASEAFVTKSVAGAALISGTPSAGQFATWVDSTHIGGISAGYGITAALAVGLSSISNSLGADVTMNTSTYVDGPSVAQGATGKWRASGTVTLNDASGATQFSCKLWDGATVIASGQVRQDVASDPRTMALSGVITSPAGNIRISCKDLNFNTGTISFNLSGNSKDSTITADRIQ